MNFLVLFTLILGILYAERPNCNVVPGMDHTKVYITPSETQVFPFKKYVQGYNLIFSATADNISVFDVVEPFYNSDSQLIPDIIGHGNFNGDLEFDFIDLDIETDGNLAWIERGAFLAQNSSNGNIFVTYGKLNDEQNLQFDQSIGITSQNISSCFNVITLSEEFLLVDCQQKDNNKNILYVINETNNLVTPYTFQNSTSTTKRKTIPLRMQGDREQLQGGRTFIFSAWLADGMEDSQKVNTKVQIYYLRKYVPEHIGTIKAENISQTDLMISDISIDALGYIYITDQRGVVTQLQFNGETVTVLQNWAFLDTKLYKTSAHTTENLVTMVHIVAENQIIEIDLEATPFRSSYQLPQNIQYIVDFQVNNQLIVLQTDSYYYVYRRYHTQVDHILSTFVSINSKFLISPRTPNLVFVNRFQSHSFITSQGFLIIKNSQEGASQTINVNAISASYDGSADVVCNFSFQVQTVNDPSLIFKKDMFPNTSSYLGSPVNQDFDLNDYFLGSRLQYDATSDDVQINLKTNNLIQINSQDNSVDAKWMKTFSYDQKNYYKLTINNNNLIIQDCNSEVDSITCKIIKNIPFTDTIAHYSIFNTANNLQNIVPVLAYIPDGNTKFTVNFIQLNGNSQISSLVVEDMFNATDVDGNLKYLYVSVRDAKIIKVYKNMLNGQYNLAYTIESTDIQGKSDEFVFLPAETILSPVDVNLLYIKGIDGIYIVRITATKAEYISTIPIPHLGFSYISSEVIVGTQTMLVLISDNTTGVKDQILEYGIYSYYQPLTLRNIDLGDKIMVRPVQAHSVADSNIVGVKTTKDGMQYLTFIKMEQPSVGSIIYDTATNHSIVSLVKSYDSIVMESVPRSNITQMKLNAFRLYQNPSLSIKASLNDNAFKENKTFILYVRKGESSESINHQIQLFDIKTKITNSNVNVTKIHLASTSNSDIILQQIPADTYFIGPIADYSILCKVCDKQIQLIDHVQTLTSSDQGQVVAFHYFADKQIIWALNHGGISALDHDLLLKRNNAFNFEFVSYDVLGLTSFNDRFIVFIVNNDDSSYHLALIETDASRQIANVLSVNQINKTNDTIIKNFQTIKTYSNRVFVLDNKLDATGKGVVYVFTITSKDDGTLDVLADISIDSSSFQTEGRINDFLTIPFNNPQSALFIATTGSNGLAYGQFDTSSQVFALTNTKRYSLKDDNRFNIYQVENSQYQQIKLISQTIKQNEIDIMVLFTVSNGMHLQVNLIFEIRQNAFTFVAFKIMNQIEKYGKQTVLNWAQVIDGVALIGYEGAGRGLKASLGYYSLNQGNQIIRQSMKGAIQSNISRYLINNLAAVLFKHNNGYRAIVAISGENENHNIFSYSLSQKIYLSYKIYETKTYQAITLVASNQYGNSYQSIPVEFDQPIGPGALAWYIILLIVLGSIAVVGLGVFLFIKYKRSKDLSKDSLLSARPEQEDEEI